MTDIKRDSLVTTEEKLLFDILQELRGMKQFHEPQEVVCSVAKDAKPSVANKKPRAIKPSVVKKRQSSRKEGD